MLKASMPRILSAVCNNKASVLFAFPGEWNDLKQMEKDVPLIVAPSLLQVTFHCICGRTGLDWSKRWCCSTISPAQAAQARSVERSNGSGAPRKMTCGSGLCPDIQYSESLSIFILLICCPAGMGQTRPIDSEIARAKEFLHGTLSRDLSRRSPFLAPPAELELLSRDALARLADWRMPAKPFRTGARLRPSDERFPWNWREFLSNKNSIRRSARYRIARSTCSQRFLCE